MTVPFESVPRLHPDCRVTVTIPARDEAAFIETTLAAFAEQRAIGGSTLPAHIFDIIVFANNCADATVARARAAARRHRHLAISIVEGRLPGPDANVGLARKRLMDCAAARYCDVARRDGIVASADADTVVDPTWIAWLERECRTVDAVAGHVTIGEPAQASMQVPVRLLYARELAFRRLVAEVESLLDPRPEDPWPRHASFVGASFGVRAATYRAAGGIVPASCLEDLAFAGALRRIDARIRHSLRVRATTSARVRSRVDGGFGTFIAGLVERGSRRDTFYVEPATFWIERSLARAALRRIWHGRGTAADDRTLGEIFRLDCAVWKPLVARGIPIGTVYAHIEARAGDRRDRYTPVPVEEAISELRETAASWNAAIPTRNSAASGAG